MYEIRGIASRISPQELDFYNLIYKFSCERMSAHPYLGGHNIMFFADTDRYLEAIEAEHLFEYNRENQMAGSLQASTSL